MTDLELLRANVQDEVSPYTWDDTKLQGVLDRYSGDVNLASAQVWLWRAGSAALRNFKYRLGDGTSVDKTMTAEECRQQATVFRSLALETPVDETVEIDWTRAFDPPEWPRNSRPKGVN